jgi:MSHA biogenesis protein MshP
MNRQRGFGAILAIVVLVIFAALAAAMAKFSATQQSTSTQDILSARALAATRSGIQWGLYQALAPGGIWTGGCSNATQTLDLRSKTGFVVTVTCNTLSYGEGGTNATAPLRVFEIVATGCNSNSSCPDATLAVTSHYIERRLQTVVTDK